MANFLTYIKNNNSNAYSLAVSILLIIWYNGLVGILNYLFPERGIVISFLLAFIPIIIFLTDDGNLDELYSSGSTTYEIAAASDRSGYKMRRGRAYMRRR